MSPEETPLLQDRARPLGTGDAGVFTPLRTAPEGDAGQGLASHSAVSALGLISDFGSHSGSGLPQNIGHRGYKAAFPENSMAGFHGAVAAGAHAVETDVHLSRDGVVVLSHVSCCPCVPFRPYRILC